MQRDGAVESNQTYDAVVVGAGLAGLSAAREMEGMEVAVLTTSSPGTGGSSGRARGGMAAAVGTDDSADLHARDTMEVGEGMCAPRAVDLLVSRAERKVEEMRELGVDFDEDPDGHLDLGREAAHSRRRIVHAGGDAIGVSLTSAVADDLWSGDDCPELVEGELVDLSVVDGEVQGLHYRDAEGRLHALAAPRVVLATGGVGWLYEWTTNPEESTGRGLAVAYRAGAQLADMEFVQFHPTALAVDASPLPLLTEALRGDGATLVDADGEALMAGRHEDGDLAPRDVVARAVGRQLEEGGSVALDVGPVEDFQRKYPAAAQAARGLEADDEEPAKLPVRPAAHYHMGGIATDLEGRTSIDGLWACGEVADTGVHGANRLASNSMLECLVYGSRAGRAVREARRDRASSVEAVRRDRERRRDVPEVDHAIRVFECVRRTMWRRVGLEREGGSLSEAIRRLGAVRRNLPPASRGRDAALVAELVARSAFRREESRGAHHRRDFPDRRDGWRGRIRVRCSAEVAEEPGLDRPESAEWSFVSAEKPPGKDAK